MITVYYYIDSRIWELAQNNYFSDWQYRIKQSNTFSAWMEMEGGIPQFKAAPVSGLYEFTAFSVGLKRLHILCNRVLFKLKN